MRRKMYMICRNTIDSMTLKDRRKFADIKMKCFTSVILILGLYTGYAAAIRCYECDSRMNKTCSDKFEASSFQPLDDCLICAKTKWKMDGEYIVERDCATSSSILVLGTDKCHSNKEFGTDVERCFCDKDLCNRAQSVSARFTLMLGLLVIFIFSL